MEELTGHKIILEQKLGKMFVHDYVIRGIVRVWFLNSFRHLTIDLLLISRSLVNCYVLDTHLSTSPCYDIYLAHFDPFVFDGKVLAR